MPWTHEVVRARQLGMKELDSESGIALIIVLWIAVVLSSVVSAGAYLARIDMRQAYYPNMEIRLVSAALAGVEKVTIGLINDETEYDSLNEPWMAPEDKDIAGVQLSVTVEDQASRLNLNRVNKSTRRMFEELAPVYDSINGSEMTDSLIDWTDNNGNLTEIEGAEEDYYKYLDPPQRCKNKPLDSVDELHLIKGFSDIKAVSLIKKLTTVYSEGKININTAPVEVLTALPGIDYLAAQEIIAARNGPDLEPGTEDDTPFERIDQIKTVLLKFYNNHEIFNIYKGLQKVIDVKSSYYKVRAEARFGRFSKVVEAMLHRKGKAVKIIYWREL